MGVTSDAVRLTLALLLVLPCAYLMLISAYLLLLTIGAVLYRKKSDPKAPPRKIALLIPAHNEEQQIPDILCNARAVDYPDDHYGLFVIADNCTDNTAACARDAGANVFERSDPENPGKGQALDWCLRTHQDTLAAYDAIALVDADMTIHPDFLRELSASLAVEDIRVVQALNTVAKPDTNWRSALGYFGFTLINHTRPAGRCWLGGTAELKGSGMAFETGLLLQYGWPAHSIAEDAEFSKQLFLDGVLVHYNPGALVTSEIPTHRRQARVQQQRWESGKLQVARKYFPILLRNALRHPSRSAVDAVLDILVPPMSLLILALHSAAALSLLVHPALSTVLGICLLALAVCIVAGPLMRKAPARVWLYLAAVPVFLLWKMLLFLRLLLRRSAATWQRTPRDSELEDKNE